MGGRRIFEGIVWSQFFTTEIFCMAFLCLNKPLLVCAPKLLSFFLKSGQANVDQVNRRALEYIYIRKLLLIFLTG